MKIRSVAETTTGKKLALILAAAILTTEGEPAPAEPTPAEPAPAEPAPAEPAPPADDLTTIFTPEEIAAKKEGLAAAKAEEARRAALTDEQRAEEDRLKAEEEAKNQIPEEYAEFSLPDGMKMDEEMLAEFKPLAKELGLNQENAQKLVDVAAKLQQRTMDGIFAMQETRRAEWLKTAQEDDEIGADVKLWDPANPDSAKASVTLRAFNSLAGDVPGLKAMVDETGIGNHPDFLRVFYRIGLRMREDGFEGGKGGGAMSAAERMYPTMRQ